MEGGVRALPGLIETPTTTYRRLTDKTKGSSLELTSHSEKVTQMRIRRDEDAICSAAVEVLPLWNRVEFGHLMIVSAVPSAILKNMTEFGVKAVPLNARSALTACVQEVRAMLIRWTGIEILVTVVVPIAAMAWFEMNASQDHVERSHLLYL